MIFLCIPAAVCLLLAAAGPWLARWGQRRLDRDTLALQALYGQLRSELRAEAHYRGRQR